ncbi:MAG TPA: hypothetical protein VM659_08085, partial [Dongiaceae bacterium]|nr:hypothetical protein [Dongiaceae bacterium]
MTVDTAPGTTDFRPFAKAGRLDTSSAWLDAVREKAIDRFRKDGFPTPRIESWKFTNLDALARTTFRDGEVIDRPELIHADLEPYRLTPDCHLIVFVNGRFRPDLSALDHIPDGTRVGDFFAADEDDLQALTAPPVVTEDPRAR